LAGSAPHRQQRYILKNYAYHACDWERGSTMLDRLLASYDLDEKLSART